jgi:hypothetical protein
MTEELKIVYYLFAELFGNLIFFFSKGLGFLNQVSQTCLPEIYPFCINTIIVVD